MRYASGPDEGDPTRRMASGRPTSLVLQALADLWFATE
jgi:hypothetical protein